MIASRTSHSTAVVVVSCDKYADLWPPFFGLFFKYWPDCSHKVYLIANNSSFEDPRITCIRVGADTSWSGNVLRGLNEIREDYVIMFLDDLFLLERVNSDVLEVICREFYELSGECLKLNPTVRGDIKFNGNLRLSSPGVPYRASTVLTLWKKDVLANLLVDGENAWDFEIKGSKRSDVFLKFYVAKKPQFRIANGVIKGKWSRRAFKQVKARSGSVLLNRPVMTWPAELAYQFSAIRFKLMSRLLPAQAARFIMDWLRNGRNAVLKPTYMTRR